MGGVAFAALSFGTASAALNVPTSASCSAKVTQNMKLGSSGSEVRELQKILNANSLTQVSVTGAGTPGNESTYFGAKTKAAVVRFQNLHSSDILNPAGLTAGNGNAYGLTRAMLNQICTGGGSTGGMTSAVPGCTSTVGFSPTTGQKCDASTTGGTTTGTVSGAATVTAGTQPVNALAVQGASRVPFTRITVSAGSSDVVMTGVTVERNGPALDAVFSGVVLMDDMGAQVGIAKTFNSNHQATVGDRVTIKAGTSRTFTVAGNMAAALTNYAGQVVGVQVDAVNLEGGSVASGMLPIGGAMHTVNASLSIGTASMVQSSFDPGNTGNQPIGTTGYRFSGVRLTAGSAEKVRLWSVRWNQTGSVGMGDLANIVVNAGGTAYPTTWSSDGKYVTATFGTGMVIDKGASIDIYIQGDVVGTSAANRTVIFSIYKNTDVYVTGETYGYGITATGSGTGFGGSTAFYAGNTLNVNNGSVTGITKATSVASQSIAAGVTGQVLGGFDADIKGEPISVQSMSFKFATTSTWGGPITNISIYGPNGNIVAGPMDFATTQTNGSEITFTDSVTFPVGKGTYTIKGKIPAGTANSATVQVSTAPNGTGGTAWANITGQTTGNTISLSGSGLISMSTMTVKAAALSVSIASTPSSQVMVAGTQNRSFAAFQFDATQSGEDVRFSTVQLTLAKGGSAAYADLTSCQLWDGTTALNTGSNVVAPTGTTANFTFDSSLTIAKGTVKTLTLKCNLSSASANNGTFSWGLTTAAANPTITGVTSSASVAANGGSYGVLSGAPTMTVGTSGTLAVSSHPSTPSYAVVASGTTGNTVGVLNFRATNEPVNLNKIGLSLTSGAVGDLSSVTLWQGSTQVGQVVFTSGNTVATTTLANPIALAKDTDVQLTIKADLAAVGTGQSGTPGRSIKIDYNSAQGTGVDSGSTVEGAGSTSFAGVRLQKSYPVITYSTTSGTAQNGQNDLLAVNIAANASGDVQVNKLTFSVSTTTVANLASANFTFTGPNGNVGSSTPILAADGSSVIVYFDSASNTNDKTIGAGTSKSYTLRYTSLSLTGSNSTGSVGVALKADAAYPSLGGPLMASTTAAGLTGQNVLWSPISTSSVSNLTAAYDDWTNGYGLGGCFASSGLGQNCTPRTIAK